MSIAGEYVVRPGDLDIPEEYSGHFGGEGGLDDEKKEPDTGMNGNE